MRVDDFSAEGVIAGVNIGRGGRIAGANILWRDEKPVRRAAAPFPESQKRPFRDGAQLQRASGDRQADETKTFGEGQGARNRQRRSTLRSAGSGRRYGYAASCLPTFADRG